MKKTNLYLLGIALLFAVALPALGQGPDDTGGCINSPENPTAILAVVGSAGAFFMSARARLKARRNSSSK
ncbi:MAG: PExPT-CTERM protein [Acidobacteriota bacterium]|nr:PExPT-CTERM protein [Acidobacteriota bacterium]